MFQWKVPTSLTTTVIDGFWIALRAAKAAHFYFLLVLTVFLLEEADCRKFGLLLV